MPTEHPPGWTCAVVVLCLERYRLSALPRAEALAVAEHLEACVVCAQRLLLVEPARGGRRG